MLRHVTTKGGRAPLPLPKQIRGDSPPPYRSRRCWGWEGTSGTYPTPRGTREQEVGEVSGARHPGQELAACPAVPGSQLAPSRSSPSAACVPALRGGEAGGAAPSTPNRGWHQVELASGGMLVASPLGWHLPGEQHPAQVVSPWGGSGRATPAPRALWVLGDAWHQGWGQEGWGGQGGWHSSFCPPPSSLAGALPLPRGPWHRPTSSAALLPSIWLPRCTCEYS